MTECIALLRGINVGRAKRIAMAHLRGLFVDLGYDNVRTLLNSGNVLFRCTNPRTNELALTLQGAIADTYGLPVPVTVLTAADLAAIVRENPLLHIVKDPSKHLVAFVAHPRMLTPLRSLMEEKWSPDALAIGTRAGYLWCADGVLDSKLSQAFARRGGEAITARNWATVLKLHAASSTAD
jgi:uncharacterized protein (DUF1697 family)